MEEGRENIVMAASSCEEVFAEQVREAGQSLWEGGWRRENVRDHKKLELGMGVRLCCGEDTNWQASNESTL